MDAKRNIRRTVKRRKTRPEIVIVLHKPGRVVIRQGTREDVIEAPEGAKIQRPKRGET